MGIAERKQLEKDARKKLILDCALAVFRQKGFVDATIGDIAELAQIAKGTIYLYFKSKADLYFSLTMPALKNNAKRLKRIANHQVDSPEVKIRKIIYALYDFYEQDVDAYNLITRYKASEYQTLLPKDRQRILVRVMRSNLKQMENIIEEGVRKEVLKKINPYAASVVFWGGFVGIIQFQENRMMPGKRDYRRATLDRFIETMLDGLLKKK